MSEKRAKRPAQRWASCRLALGPLVAGLVLAGACGGDKKNDTPGALIKFCNPLSRSDGMPFDLNLEIGSMSPAKITAASITCAPAAKQPCLKVPAGTNVPVVLKNGDTRLFSVVVDEFKVNEEWLIVADLDAMNRPVIDGGPIPAAAMATCADLAFSDIFDTTGGPGPMPDGGAAPPTPRM